ncbi:hypothetical protein [Paenibacillus paeoniae]|uniref:RNA polymerase subunit sigma n=1 Tax=Paenibacillus paeoniae TaxID=2292705 RepID=A0A371PKR0_9BACL|nr:hypothetical protein [Paenibacillus paeoniae]REK76535.1 hypothetical protein DX130_05705 [Paenibacillus paeoniae]
MTFKPLDLQMSVPRTQEFSGMQQQAAQRPLTEQNMLANQASKQTEEMRNQNTAVEKSSNPQVRADQDGANDGGYKRGNRKKGVGTEEESGVDEPPVHPYKGHHLDIKL